MRSNLTVLPEALTPTGLQRLAHKAVNNLGLSLVDVAVERRDNGRVAIVLPEGWAYIFLAHLDATAKQIQEQLRRAMHQAKLKDVRIQEQLEVAAREWEGTQIKAQERYRELLSEGLTKREAIRRIKSESQGVLSATLIQGIVESGDPRKKRERLERDAKIRALRAQGFSYNRISTELNVRESVVASVLRRGGQRGYDP